LVGLPNSPRWGGEKPTAETIIRTCFSVTVDFRNPAVGLCRKPVFVFFFLKKPDWAGRTEFAVNLRILALQTLLAKKYLMLHAPKTGFSFWMIDTGIYHILFS
jgi:hypothetical protein